MLPRKAIVVLMSLSATILTAAPFRQVLTSVDRGVHLDSWEVSQKSFKLPGARNWSVRKVTLHGGKQEGVDLILVDNGKLQFSVIPNRGMGIFKVEAQGIRLGWDSPVKEIVDPRFVNLQSRGGLGWLEGFNEFMVRCGLEFAGHPGKDKFINNVGDEAEMDLTLHGKIGNIPASEVEVLIDRESGRIAVRGRVDERMFYGPKLELWTEISTTPGSLEFRIRDVVKNHGAFPQEFQMIYHSNYGPPLLEKGASFAAPTREVIPFNAHAAKGIEQYAAYEGPAKGFIEQVYCLHPKADASGRTVMMLHTADKSRGTAIRFSVAELPYITLWKNTNASEEGYVTGLEPGTGFPSNRKFEREGGRVPKLQPGATREFTLDYSILDTEGTARVLAEIAAIQGNSKPVLSKTPLR